MVSDLNKRGLKNTKIIKINSFEIKIFSGFQDFKILLLFVNI